MKVQSPRIAIRGLGFGIKLGELANPGRWGLTCKLGERQAIGAISPVRFLTASAWAWELGQQPALGRPELGLELEERLHPRQVAVPRPGLRPGLPCLPIPEQAGSAAKGQCTEADAAGNDQTEGSCQLRASGIRSSLPALGPGRPTTHPATGASYSWYLFPLLWKSPGSRHARACKEPAQRRPGCRRLAPFRRCPYRLQ